jgi:hypothetical protein
LLLALGQGLKRILYLADAPYLSVLLLVAATLGGSSALVMPWRGSFGTRLIIGMLAGTAMTGHILVLVLGVPGTAVHGAMVWTVLVTAAAFVSLLILVLERPVPRRTEAGAGRIVASPTVGSPTVGSPTVGSPTVGSPNAT